MYDIIIIGGGTAGLTAAIYARRAGKSVLVLEKSALGGQITSSPEVENIPGFLRISGIEFAESLVNQAQSHGALIEYSEATEVKDGSIKTVKTKNGSFEGKTVIFATGTRYRHLGLENEDKLIGNGISFCAICDGALYQDKTVAVIGGGSSALLEALQLSPLARRVYIVQKLERLTGEAVLRKQVEARDNINIYYNSMVTKLSGETRLNGITITNKLDDSNKQLEVDGIFVAIGLVPQNEYFSNLLNLDKWGYANYPESCITNHSGIFVAGDCRKKDTRQIVTAAADGAASALAACNYLDSL